MSTEGILKWERSEERGDLTIYHSTQFSHWRREGGLSDSEKYRAATHGIKIPDRLPLQMDVWHEGKVLNIEWDNDGRLVVVGYKPGEWERLIEEIAIAASQSKAVASAACSKSLQTSP